jgi:hypothetical protein
VEEDASVEVKLLVDFQVEIPAETNILFLEVLFDSE